MRSFYDIAKDSGTDKVTTHNYHMRYPIFFEHLRQKPIKLFEMGLAAGKSIKVWMEYFEDLTFTGLDINPRFEVNNTEECFVYTGDQRNERLLIDITKTRGPFDIIIDDAGHRMNPQQVSFKTLFPTLPSGGWYVIEDTQTSYMQGFKGGYKRKSSTIELLKNCVDILHSAKIEEELAKDGFKELYPYNLIDGIFFFEKIVFIRRKPEVLPQPFVTEPNERWQYPEEPGSSSS